MNFFLERIPDDLWRKIRIAALARGKSERSFLLDAAFNEIERTNALLPSSAETSSPIKPVTSPATKPAGEICLRNLRTVGINTFITYYELLLNSKNSDAVEFLREKEGYAYTSASTKVSTGKRIIRDPDALRFCLSHIAFKAERINNELKIKAKEILESL